MEKTKCAKCGKEVYITSLGRILEDYKNATLITHKCKNVPIIEDEKPSE